MKITKLTISTLIYVTLLFFGSDTPAQTSAFNYQGRLNDNNVPANGSYEMQFRLYDSLAGGGQVGATQTVANVNVSNGVFTVLIDFGANAFSGANRFLDVSVRRTPGDAFTPLSPRTQVHTAPYSIRSNSAAAADSATTASQLGGVAAGQYVQTTDPRMSDARNPLPNSGNYIQNTQTAQAANFNVSGSGSVGTLTTSGPATFGGVATPANAPAGQGRIYFDSASSKFKVSQNGGGFVDLVGSGGVTGSGTTNSLALWSAGTSLGTSALSQVGTNIGIGLATPNGRLGIGTSPAWTSHSWGGSIELENASAIGWRENPSGYRFGLGRTTDGMVMFRTPVNIGTTTGAPPLYDFKIDNEGNVGIGNTALNMTLNAKLTVVSGGYGLDHTNGTTTLSTFVGQSIPNNVPSGGWVGTRTNHPLYFFTNQGLPKVTLAANGNVGIGTTSPAHSLQVNGVTSLGAPGGVYGYVVDQTAPGPYPTLGFNNFYSGGAYVAGTAGTGGIFQYQNGDGKLVYYTAPPVAAGSSLSFTPRMAILQNGNVGFGTINPTNKLEVVGTTKTSILQITGGSDLAENFAVAGGNVKPGVVVAIDPKRSGKLVVARGQYNRRVAGIVSGANDLAAGMLLPDLNGSDDSHPVALSGRVWVYADAATGAIRPGDLLTSSNTPGHAMRVGNYRRAQGAIIGKAMSGLRSGRGMVLVLVSLQ